MAGLCKLSFARGRKKEESAGKKVLSVGGVELHNGFALFVRGEQGIYPMNEESATLHATEPCHLAFGELVNGRFESGKHGLVVRLPRQIQGDEFVFQPVIDQIIGRNATVEKSLDFLYHTLVHTGMEPVRYPFASGVAIQIETDDQTVDRRKLGAFGRIVLDVFGYFDSLIARCAESTSVLLCRGPYAASIRVSSVKLFPCRRSRSVGLGGTSGRW